MNDRDITTLALTHLLDASGASEHKIAAMGNLQRQVEIFLEKRVVAGGLGRREACAVLANMLAIQLTREPEETTVALCKHIPTLRGLYKGVGTRG